MKTREKFSPKLGKAIVLAALAIGCGACDSGTPTETAAPPAEAPQRGQEVQAGAPANVAPAAPQPKAAVAVNAALEECLVLMDAQPDYGKPPLQVSFSADVECTEGSQVTYAWDFGDGSAPSSEPGPVHTYAGTGDYIATLKVTDSTGAVGTDEMDIFVEEDAEPLD